MRVLRILFRKLPPPPTTTFNYRGSGYPNFMSLLPAGAVIYDIGAKQERGYEGRVLPQGAVLRTIDIDPAARPDIVADAHDLSVIPENSADCVMAVSVLEHVRDPRRVVAEMYRILKPGGIIYVNVPFVFPFHADPDDFWRFSHRGIALLCSDFETVEAGFNRGPASCMAHLNVQYLALLFSFRNEALYSLMKYVLQWLLAWTKHLDRYVARHPLAYLIHAGAFFVGRKPV